MWFDEDIKEFLETLTKQEEMERELEKEAEEKKDEKKGEPEKKEGQGDAKPAAEKPAEAAAPKPNQEVPPKPRQPPTSSASGSSASPPFCNIYHHYEFCFKWFAFPNRC